MKHIKVVAFDCDGVMFDSEEANTAYYNQVLNHIGKPAMTPEQAAYAHVHTVGEVIGFLVPEKESLEKANAYRKQIGYLPFIRHMRIEPHLKSLLRFLRPNYKIAIATNRTDTMPRVLSDHGLEGQFDQVVTALDVTRPKPDPEMLLKILKFFKINADQMLYIGDSALDSLAAKGAGAPFVAYDNPTLSAEYHIQSLKELESSLRNGSIA
jgi:phosphoglycolate phosphatase